MSAIIKIIAEVVVAKLPSLIYSLYKKIKLDKKVKKYEKDPTVELLEDIRNDLDSE